MSSSNSLDVEQKFTVFVDRAPIPDEGNSLVLIIVIVVIVLLVVVITGMIISVVIMFATADCNVKYGQIFEIVFSETNFCSGDAGGVREEEREVVLQLV